MEAFEACGEALAGHRAAGAVRKEAASLRLYSRLLLVLGRDQDAVAAGKKAVALLETLPPDRDLAVAYANLAELAMTREDPGQAIAWGQRALELAHEFDDSETACHADVCIGAIEAQRGDPAGSARLERTLEAAIDAGFEEVAARAFDSLVREAVRARNFAAIDRYLAPWRRLLQRARSGELASVARRTRRAGRSRPGTLERRRLAGAARVLRTARTQGSAPALARSVLALVRARRGDPGVDEALEFPVATDDAGGARQRLDRPLLQPARCTSPPRAEIAWLTGQATAGLQVTEEAFDLAIRADAAWIVGELAYWRWRAGIVEEIPALSGRDLRAFDPRRLAPRGRVLDRAWLPLRGRARVRRWRRRRTAAARAE